MEQQNFNPSQQTDLTRLSPKGIKPIWPIILLVLVVALVGVLLWQKNNANQIVDALQQQIISLQNQINNKIIATTSDETANWKTYSNIGEGIELKYPVSYLAKEYRINVGDASQPSELFSLGIYEGEKIFFNFTETNWTYEGEGKPDIVSGFSKEVVVDGIIGYTRVVESMKDGHYLYVTPIKKDNKIYEFWGDGLIFDKILSTFRFTK